MSQLLLAGQAVAAAPSSGTADNAALADQSSGNQAELAAETAIVAKAYHISLAQASLDLSLQDEVGQLDARLADSFPSTYGGLWIQHGPQYRVVASFVGDAGSAVSRSIGTDLTALTPYVQTQAVSWSAAQLAGIANGLSDAAHANHFAVSVDIKLNRVLVEPTADTDRTQIAEQVASATAAAVPSVSRSAPASNPVVIASYDSAGHSTSSVYGGLNVVSYQAGNNSSCTVGFGVTDIDLGTKDFVTAGHCGNDPASVNGINTPYLGGSAYGSADAQEHSAPGQTITNKVLDGGSGHLITGKTTRLSQPIGGIVCKYGITTHYTCGDILSRTFLPTWIDHATATYVKVEPITAGPFCDHGDSGGPVYASGYAYGIIQGAWTASTYIGIYTPENYIESTLGVHILL